MAAGSAQKDFTRASPRTPKAPAMAPTQTRFSRSEAATGLLSDDWRGRHPRASGDLRLGPTCARLTLAREIPASAGMTTAGDADSQALFRRLLAALLGGSFGRRLGWCFGGSIGGFLGGLRPGLALLGALLRL